MMIRNVAAAGEMPLMNDGLALCQRVFYHVCADLRIKDRAGREKLARSILDQYRSGVQNEGVLRGMFIDGTQSQRAERYNRTFNACATGT
jgi:hypothetical protein